MRASSMGVEVSVDLFREELTKLEKQVLTGEIRSHTHHLPSVRNIPFTLKYNPKQEKFLLVFKRPKKGYFGDASEVLFSINSEFYQDLQERKEGIDRFYGAAGKLHVHVR